MECYFEAAKIHIFRKKSGQPLNKIKIFFKPNVALLYECTNVTTLPPPPLTPNPNPREIKQDNSTDILFLKWTSKLSQ